MPQSKPCIRSAASPQAPSLVLYQFSWQTLGLFPLFFDSNGQGCLEHLCVPLCVDVCFHFSWVCPRRWHCWVTLYMCVCNQHIEETADFPPWLPHFISPPATLSCRFLAHSGPVSSGEWRARLAPQLQVYLGPASQYFANVHKSQQSDKQKHEAQAPSQTRLHHYTAFTPTECVRTWLPHLPFMREHPYQRRSVSPTESTSFHLQHRD